MTSSSPRSQIFGPNVSEIFFLSSIIQKLIDFCCFDWIPHLGGRFGVFGFFLTLSWHLSSTTLSACVKPHANVRFCAYMEAAPLRYWDYLRYTLQSCRLYHQFEFFYSEWFRSFGYIGVKLGHSTGKVMWPIPRQNAYRTATWFAKLLVMTKV